MTNIFIPLSPTPAVAQSLAGQLKYLASNDTAYDEHMAWRSKKLSELSPGFQRLVELTKLDGPECQLCQRIAKKRYELESQ